MEAARPRRHSLGVTESSALSHRSRTTHRDVATAAAELSEGVGLRRPRRDGSKLNSSTTRTRRRTGSSTGRRRSSGGSADFAFAPYAPMMLDTYSASPRARRASAPVPPSTLPQAVAVGRASSGPSLEQCLVLPGGDVLALKESMLSATSDPSGGDAGSCLARQPPQDERVILSSSNWETEVSHRSTSSDKALDTENERNPSDFAGVQEGDRNKEDICDQSMTISAADAVQELREGGDTEDVATVGLAGGHSDVDSDVDPGSGESIEAPEITCRTHVESSKLAEIGTGSTVESNLEAQESPRDDVSEAVSSDGRDERGESQLPTPAGEAVGESNAICRQRGRGTSSDAPVDKARDNDSDRAGRSEMQEEQHIESETYSMAQDYETVEAHLAESDSKGAQDADGVIASVGGHGQLAAGDEGSAVEMPEDVADSITGRAGAEEGSACSGLGPKNLASSLVQCSLPLDEHEHTVIVSGSARDKASDGIHEHRFDETPSASPPTSAPCAARTSSDHVNLTRLLQEEDRSLSLSPPRQAERMELTEMAPSERQGLQENGDEDYARTSSPEQNEAGMCGQSVDSRTDCCDGDSNVVRSNEADGRAEAAVGAPAQSTLQDTEGSTESIVEAADQGERDKCELDWNAMALEMEAEWVLAKSSDGPASVLPSPPTIAAVEACSEPEHGAEVDPTAKDDSSASSNSLIDTLPDACEGPAENDIAAGAARVLVSHTEPIKPAPLAEVDAVREVGDDPPPPSADAASDVGGRVDRAPEATDQELEARMECSPKAHSAGAGDAAEGSAGEASSGTDSITDAPGGDASAGCAARDTPRDANVYDGVEPSKLAEVDPRGGVGTRLSEPDARGGRDAGDGGDGVDTTCACAIM